MVDGTSLAHDGYYEAFDQFGDFGLTIDGAFALAATGTDNATLKKVVDFIDGRGKDRSGRSIDDWTGIGTAFASGGAIGKEALLAEVTGFDPHNFGGHDLIAGVDGLICTTTDVANGCAAPGNYLFATSTFSQALGIIAQLRAGDTTHAAAPIAYLESLQNSDGSWPSLIPSSGDSDVDSTAMAAMALALLSTDATASAAVTKAVTWIATEAERRRRVPGRRRRLDELGRAGDPRPDARGPDLRRADREGRRVPGRPAERRRWIQRRRRAASRAPTCARRRKS